MENSRRTAAFAVAAWLRTRQRPETMLGDGESRAFVQDLVYTTLRRLRSLRFALGGLVQRWPKGELEALLYIGAAQILYMDDVPDFAAVSATVEAAKRGTNPALAPVVNGVLRNLVRTRDAVLRQLAEAPLDVRESMPRAIVRRWSARFGESEAARLCALMNEEARTFLAWKPGKGPAGGDFTPLARGLAVAATPGYSDGDFIVQDPATAAAVRLLAPQPGERVLDACAAPGGKSAQLAWRGAAVTALEVNPRRRRRMADNFTRLRLDVQTVAEWPALGSGFDAVLVDAPCSNTGVLRRRPDARWNWSEDKLAALVRLQAEILDTAAERVRPGGRLVYSTCSLEPEENAMQTAAFLGRHPDFTAGEAAEISPLDGDHDGAFAQVLRRRNAAAGEGA